jgi:large repetitive protein
MKRRHRRSAVVMLASSVVIGGVLAIPLAASADSINLLTEPFTSATTTSSNWVLPASSASIGANDACLTASTDQGQTPIPGCYGGDDPVPPAAGPVPGLQLTTNDYNQEGGVAYGLSVPTSQGLDVTFDTNQYDGTGADGISFFLAGSDPTNPASTPITLGPAGGALGYMASSGNPGLTNAYLGVGLDAYGNFTNPIGASGCSDTPAFSPEQLVVRGPGNGAAGYCQLNQASTNPLDIGSGTPVTVPVEVAINPSNSSLTTPDGLAVAADSYAVSIVDTQGTTHTLSGSLPDASAYLPSAWLDSNGLPKQLTFGWTGSTGASTDYHTISNVSVDSLTGTPPQLGVALGDNSNGSARTGQTVVYTAQTTVTAADENKTITLTDTFPTDLVPQTNGLGGTGWSCGVSGQTVTCTAAPPVTAGTTLSLAMPVTVAVPAGAGTVSLGDTATVSSPDGNPSSATDTQTYLPAPTATVLSFVTQPVNAQVNTAMTNADSTQTHIQVAADVTAGGAVDPTYTGTVTLAFSNNPSNAKFVVGGSPTATLTAQAVNGVADFSPIIVNAVGFGDTLTATATGLTPAVSSAFDVNSAQTVCQSGKTCTTTTTNTTTGESLTVTGAAGTGTAVITASIGGNVAPIHPCTTSSTAIVTVNGNRQKTLKLTFPTPKIPVVTFCWGQPTQFLNVLYQKVTYFSTANQEYEGLLPACLPKFTGPCVSGLTITKATETVTIQSGSADPHASY